MRVPLNPWAAVVPERVESPKPVKVERERMRLGRPAIEHGESRVRFVISLTKSQRDRLTKVAKNRSAFIRYLIDRELDEISMKSPP